MPSKNMLPKGKRRHTVKPLYRATRGLIADAPELEGSIHPPTVTPAPPTPKAPSVFSVPPSAASAPAPSPVLREIPRLHIDPYGEGAAHADHVITVPSEADGLRLDQYLARAIPEISRARVQLLIGSGQVLLNDAKPKGKDRVVTGDTIHLHGSPTPPPLTAQAEDIPLDILFEDESLAIVNKPAGMSVHAGAAATRPNAEEDAEGDDHANSRDPRTSGTMVNALLHHFAGKLSGVGGELRPGIVHRLDKQTSGLLVVAKDDRTHSRLANAFAEREVEKVYLALVHGDLRARSGSRTHSHPDEITVDLPIGRDLARRTRMTTRRPADGTGVRSAVSHVRVLERLETIYGVFSLVEVRIETGRTHQIRVHLQALGHPVVGDTMYGAPAQLLPLPATLPPGSKSGVWRSRAARPAPVRLEGETLKLDRNFLHAARLSLAHPRTGAPLAAIAPLPPELLSLLVKLGSRLGPTLGPAPALAQPPLSSPPTVPAGELQPSPRKRTSTSNRSTRKPAHPEKS